jgi:hypothetical protein
VLTSQQPQQGKDYVSTRHFTVAAVAGQALCPILEIMRTLLNIGLITFLSILSIDVIALAFRIDC